MDAPNPSDRTNTDPEHALGAGETMELAVTFDVPAGALRFEWARRGGAPLVALGRLVPEVSSPFVQIRTLAWHMEDGVGAARDFCGATSASAHALLRRIRQRLPVAGQAIRFGVLTDIKLGNAEPGRRLPLALPPGADPWKWLGRQIVQFARVSASGFAAQGDVTARGRIALHLVAAALLRVAPTLPNPGGGAGLLFDVRVTFDQIKGLTEFVWTEPASRAIAAVGVVRPTGANQLSWELQAGGRGEPVKSTSSHRNSIRGALGGWLKRFPTNLATFTAFWLSSRPGTSEPLCEQEPPFPSKKSPYPWLEDQIAEMAVALRFRFSPLGRIAQEIDFERRASAESHARRMKRREQKRLEDEARRRAAIAQLAEERRRRGERAAAGQREADVRRAAGAGKTAVIAPPPRPRAPAPPVPVTIKPPPLALQDTVFPLVDLNGYALRERAALWWVSNQSDDLLCLPNCRIQRLEYQLRTALRVLGPLHGRALLSDEVGLGKTIEAGLVTKELFTRGMVKRFLVLTLPSLVDQWAEELEDKFGLAAVTTNEPAARADHARFWSGNTGIVASLHTLKQPAQLEIARQVHWDMLIVDEAHYLRNRASQAWQAVNVLPRQFLLLLTATPVQNSLEELYNLVTLLQPGQLPSPREFRARFLDPKRPRQPREPEALRRMLGQVMIRNTRANAGVDLPPRSAETVVFTPDDAEAAFWREWETEFRAGLARLGAGQASLWGRLLLQAAGSSPAAWRAALEKFPDAAAARGWRERAPLETSWRRKCELLVPLTRGENGAVIFTQFLDTQAALADFMRRAGVDTFVINGSTPPPERQPITEQFHRRGGALLLTHSGTEGRNLQFCHTLANFDLPWNPMEIEQRIGRLHRLGQRHPVRICNFVQAGTLQEHLLQVLQEKLNLFELVVGETGLVLGERFSGDEFEEEVFRRWQGGDGKVAEAIAGLGEELAGARERHNEVKQLDETLFAKDFESL